MMIKFVISIVKIKNRTTHIFKLKELYRLFMKWISLPNLSCLLHLSYQGLAASASRNTHTEAERP